MKRKFLAVVWITRLTISSQNARFRPRHITGLPRQTKSPTLPEFLSFDTGLNYFVRSFQSRKTIFPKAQIVLSIEDSGMDETERSATCSSDKRYDWTTSRSGNLFKQWVTDTAGAFLAISVNIWELLVYTLTYLLTEVHHLPEFFISTDSSRKWSTVSKYRSQHMNWT